MARSSKFEHVAHLGTILGTESSGANHCVFYNSRPDGASVRLKTMVVQGYVTASATNYYTITWKNDAGSTIGTTVFSSTGLTGTTPTTVSLTAANCLLKDGEAMYGSFAQTGNGMTICGLAVHCQFDVEKV